MSSIKKRLITAAIALPIVILGIICLPEIYFLWVTGVIILLGLWEWAALATLQAKWHKGLYLLIGAVLLFFVHYIPVQFTFSIALLTWCMMGYWLSMYPQRSQLWHRSLGFRLVLGILLLLPAWQAINFIRWHQQGLILLFLVLLLIWSMDSGAYFVGKSCGKKPLALHISPNKTREGFYGGFLLAAFIGALYTYFLLPYLFFIPLFGLLLLVTILQAVLGDLVESMIKRLANVKDSGQLLPGHGGILDRLDSLFASAPIFALGVWLVT